MNPEGTIPGWKSYKITGGSPPYGKPWGYRAPWWFADVLLAGILIAILTAAQLYVVYHTPQPVPPPCKICHCHKVSCHRECGEENMCVLRCEGLCGRK